MAACKPVLIGFELSWRNFIDMLARFSSYQSGWGDQAPDSSRIRQQPNDQLLRLGRKPGVSDSSDRTAAVLKALPFWETLTSEL
jgi:hypothetical protein